MKEGTVRKVRNVVLMVLVIFLGVALMICNFFKIVPGMDSTLTQVITIQIAYGLPLGIVYIVLGVASLMETINE